MCTVLLHTFAPFTYTRIHTHTHTLSHTHTFTHSHTRSHTHTQALVLPFNILVSKLAKDMEDRAMMVNLNYLSFGR